ncbi:CDP-glycerol glycerophosphotransferase family protein [Chloroflexota bacterium]
MGHLKIMFVVCNDAEARLIYPVWQELDKKTKVDITNISTGKISSEKTAMEPEDVLKELGMPFKKLTDYKTLNVVRVLKAEQPNVLVVGGDQEYLRRSFVYAADGLGIPTLLLRLGISSNTANTPRVAMKRTVYRLTHHFKNIIHKYLYLLRTVVVLRWNPYKILRMVLQDIWIAFSTDDAGGRFGCRAIAVAGSWEKQILTERGVDLDKIIITGDPRLNFSSQIASRDSATRLYRELGINKGDKIILLLTSAQIEHGRWSQEMRARFIHGVIASLTPLLDGSVHLVVKIHPVENLEEYREIIDPGENRVILRKDLVLSDIINASDVVMTGGYSTTVLEACALRKPVILLNIFGEIEDIPYVGMGLVIGVYRLDELKNTVEKLLYNRSARANFRHKAELFFNSNKEFVDGKAATRITDLILKLAGLHQIPPRVRITKG